MVHITAKSALELMASPIAQNVTDNVTGIVTVNFVNVHYV